MVSISGGIVKLDCFVTVSLRYITYEVLSLFRYYHLDHFSDQFDSPRLLPVLVQNRFPVRFLLFCLNFKYFKNFAESFYINFFFYYYYCFQNSIDSILLFHTFLGPSKKVSYVYIIDNTQLNVTTYVHN